MNPGVEFANWLQTNVVALFAAILGVFGIIVLFRRKIMQGIMLLLIAAVGAIFVFNGSEFAQSIANLVMSWFS